VKKGEVYSAWWFAPRAARRQDGSAIKFDRNAAVR